MNPDTNAPLAANGQSSVDAEHPWLGLASFTEETRAFFHGREQEVAELARRVQRKLLTVLFGQSGLGKTSMLRAGLVPRLRPDGYCPVYVRIDYAKDAPPPSEQIKQAIYRETASSGAWTQAGVAVEGESLWEFLHHRDDVLRDANGRTLTPLLIFDQFEEIFTLAQADDFGRQRAAQFIEDLADLVENRPPKALEERLDEDESAVDRFDFTRGDYRILIALREDYLAHAEGLKGVMPSITQNRMRLARMTGAQALDAVLKPGGHLVSREVAEAIVRFVAGGSELANAEVEPSLLSLICRELNNARVAQGRSEISVDLLAGSHASILAEFYERALADQPGAVRRFIEEELLTDSGFRENIAEERVRKAFADAGAAPDTLARLVDRRLLRIEERLDVRRVELTHDVLCDVVRASRETRHAREAQEVAERQLVEQRAREEATRHALRRARLIAAGCAILAVFAVAGGLYGTISAERAHVAEVEAKRTRAMAEQARGEAERLIVYLLDDFHRELEPVGRLDVVAGLARRAIDYYEALPKELATPETDRNRALALVRYGTVMRGQGDFETARKALADAVDMLQKLRDRGDSSESSAIGLSLGLVTLALTANDTGGQDVVAMGQRAAEVLAPYGRQEKPSLAVRRAQGLVLDRLGFLQARNDRLEEAVVSLQAAREALRSVDGLDADTDALARFGQSSSWLSEALVNLGRHEEAERVTREGRVAATRVLERQPTNMVALRARGLLSAALAETADTDLRQGDRLQWIDEAGRDWITLTTIDPSNAIAWNNLAAAQNNASFALADMGRPREALTRVTGWPDFETIAARARFPSPIVVYRNYRAGYLAGDLGQTDLSDKLLANADQHAARYLAGMPAGSFERGALSADLDTAAIEVALGAGNLARARQRAKGLVERIEALVPPNQSGKLTQHRLLRRLHFDLGVIDSLGGDDAAAVDHLRAALRHAAQVPTHTREQRAQVARAEMWLAVALARQGRLEEARPHAERALAFHRTFAKKKHDEMSQIQELAAAVYANALAAPSQARSLLVEASSLMASLPAEMRATRSTAFWHERISAALRESR